MARNESPEHGTLLIAALLILALIFAGYWIMYYAQYQAAPWTLLPWFGGAAAVIMVIGLITHLLGGSKSE